MKILVDGAQVSSASYYYLLESKDREHRRHYDKRYAKPLHKLNISEYVEFWNYAVSNEFSLDEQKCPESSNELVTRIRSEANMMSSCCEFVDRNLNKEEQYRQVYMKGVDFVLDRVFNP